MEWQVALRFLPISLSTACVYELVTSTSCNTSMLNLKTKNPHFYFQPALFPLPLCTNYCHFVPLLANFLYGISTETYWRHITKSNFLHLLNCCSDRRTWCSQRPRFVRLLRKHLIGRLGRVACVPLLNKFSCSRCLMSLEVTLQQLWLRTRFVFCFVFLQVKLIPSIIFAFCNFAFICGLTPGDGINCFELRKFMVISLLMKK